MAIIKPDDMWSVYATVATSAAVGSRLESTIFGRALSAPVCAMLCSAVLTNLGIMPEGSIHISNLINFVVKLATPILLLGADIKKIFKETGVMLVAFMIGTFGTLLGSAAAYTLFAQQILMEGEGWKVASALTAKNIGGYDATLSILFFKSCIFIRGLNFMAVASLLSISPKSLGIGLAVDNVLGLIYFPLVSYLGRSCKPEIVPTEEKSTIEARSDDAVEVGALTTALSLGLGIAALSEWLGIKFGVASINVSVTLAVVIASLFPSQLKSVIPCGDLIGRLLLMLFFGAIGNASGTVLSTLSSPSTLALFGFGSVLYIVHLLVIFGGGSLLKIPLPDILLASNANIGNAATASALASAKGWRSRALPALLVGTLGNVVGTAAGLALGRLYLLPTFTSAAAIPMQ